MPYRIERVVTIPPHLAIEIVSPDDKAAGILRKVSDYLYFGVPHIWIVNPYKHTVQEADREDIRPCPSLVVETELVGPVDFNELFAQIDRESIE
jgi:Uma2 family endonuclease